MITLSRPLVCLDLETTGLDEEEDQIIQVALQKYPAGELFQQEPTMTWSTLVQPEVSVSKDVLELTGIRREDLQEAPPFEDIAPELMAILEGADLAGFNIEGFDRKFLIEELSRIGREMPPPGDRAIIDAYLLEKALVGRDLGALHQKYEGEKLEGAHDARADVIGTMNVLQGQLRDHAPKAQAPEDLQEIARDGYLDPDHMLRRLDGGGVSLNFGKHSKRTVEQVLEEDPSWLKWAVGEIGDLREHFLNRFAELMGECSTCKSAPVLTRYEDDTWMIGCKKCNQSTRRFDNPVDPLKEWRGQKQTASGQQ